MSKILFIDYDNTLHDTDAKFAPVLDGVYGLSSEQLMETYLLVHRRIIHQQYPEKHDDFFFHQKLIHEHLNRPYDETEARRIASMFKEAQEETWTSPLFYPDTLEFLDKAKENHILCLTTGDFAQKKAKALEKASGKSHFSYVFDNNNLGMKGGSSYFKNALSSTNSRPEDVIAIGDSLEHDIIAAKEAGIKAVWINRKGLPHVTTSPGPDYQARDLIEVLGY
ncbi:MAG: HAD family hydrolase, partial [Chloroflexota bacterium]|nr:HAD family hydrolase [Chloroflexota bacterium]